MDNIEKIDEALAHYGILGMKWGRRKARSSSEDAVKAATLKKKRASELTDAELAAAIKRMQLEKSYNEMNPTTAMRAKKQIRQTVGGPLKNLTNQLVAAYIKENGEKIVKAGLTKLAADLAKIKK